MTRPDIVQGSEIVALSLNPPLRRNSELRRIEGKMTKVRLDDIVSREVTLWGQKHLIKLLLSDL